MSREQTIVSLNWALRCGSYLALSFTTFQGTWENKNEREREREREREIERERERERERGREREREKH